VRTVVLDPARVRAERAPNTVELLSARSTRRHAITAVLSVRENMRVDVDDAMRGEAQVALLRARAARLGCDAILISRADSMRCGSHEQGCFESYGHLADCIVWKDGVPRAQVLFE
jgi:hypothetical protein